ncbi:hypothetical protein CspHIS471_0311610 [Cutaneotrichosporon sp. HIS471]|nr:hypothetical protein CspHIS471_0311610 [Cutaneotrichosporon sp. HIS471]
MVPDTDPASTSADTDPASTSPVPAGAQPPRSRTRPPSSTSKQSPQPPSKQSPSPTPPPPSRTLKQPMTLRVTEASEANAGVGDKAELRRAFEKRVQYARRAERLNVPRLPVLPGVPVAVSGSGQLAGLPLPLPGGEVQVPSPLFSKNSPLSSEEELANSTITSRRAGSSLLSAEHAGLATSVINASRKMAVVEPSDDSEEEEEEWAKAMGWGAGPEVDALFAVAAESRKLMQDSEGTAEQSTQAASSG